MSELLQVPLEITEDFKDRVYGRFYMLIRLMQEEELYPFNSREIKEIFLFAASGSSKEKILTSFRKTHELWAKQLDIFNEVFELGSCMAEHKFAYIKILYEEFFEK